MKIFGIGLTRTGTTSLRAAMKVLGFPLRNIGHVDECDGAFIGDRMVIPNDRYLSLHRDFPEGKFILTIRENEHIWFNSVCNRAELKKNNIGIRNQRKLMYGFEMPHGHESKFKDIYRGHIISVCGHFFESSNFMMFCTGKDGWDELCGFLGVEVPDVEFPHKNKSICK